jgi:outer membrane protein assembly factor BamB
VFVGGLQNAFYALSRSDGQSVGWSLDRGNKAGLSDSSAAIWTGPSQPVAFFGSGQGDLYAVETDDATEYWSGQDTPNVGSAITSTPAVSNGTVFAGTNNGRVLAWDASTANKQWEQSVDGPIYSELAADSGLVYVTTNNGTLHVLDATDGTKQWKAILPVELGASSPTLANNRVHVAADQVYTFDAGSSKNQLSSTSTFGGTAGSNPVVLNGTSYVGSADGNLYAYNTSDGSEQWTYPTDGPIAATPALNDSNDRIAVPSTDGTLYLLDTSGSKVDSVSIPSGTRASPIIDNGDLFLPAADGKVYAFK